MMESILMSGGVGLQASAIGMHTAEETYLFVGPHIHFRKPSLIEERDASISSSAGGRSP